MTRQIRVIAALLFGLPLAFLLAAFIAQANVRRAYPVVDSTWFDTLSVSQQRDSIVADEARKAGVPAHLAIAVSHTENWTGDSTATSRVGAIGLMQVMPRYWQHEFEAECGCGSLLIRRINACKGVRVLKRYIDSLPNVNEALRAYHGSNKPWLHAAGDGYVATVLQRISFPRDGTTVTTP